MPLIRIGTRESRLACWQAQYVKDSLFQYHAASELVPIKSEGDIDLTTPLYAMGVQGVFTRTLDIALLNGSIDIAVHSMKDVPVQLPKGLVQAAVLERASSKDIFVIHPEFMNNVPMAVGNEQLPAYMEDLLIKQKVTIATSSIRRQAQWLSKFPHHHIENLRGNVNSRLKKLYDSTWAGAIFAAAGLERIGMRPSNSFDLDWMLPAPGQGAIMIVAREDNYHAIEVCKKLNHPPTAVATQVERDFLRALMGGCSTPVSALCEISNGYIYFRGSVTSPDGSKTVSISKEAKPDQYQDLGKSAAEQIIQTGGAALLEKKQ